MRRNRTLSPAPVEFHPRRMRILAGALPAAMAVILTVVTPGLAEPDGTAGKREKAQKLYKDGNYKDAWQIYEALALDPANDPRAVSGDLNMAVSCLQQLNRVQEVDAFREKVIAVHQKNWRLLAAAAQSLISTEHYGYIVSGEFNRGHHRGGGRYVNAMERDRVRALQLMAQAMPLLDAEKDIQERSAFFTQFADLTMQNRQGGQAWRLQYLSDLAALPDYDEGYYYRGDTPGAPVKPDGTPLYYSTPKTFEGAQSDGERWRWLLAQALEFNPQRMNEIRFKLAGFLHEQFGVQTMAYYGRFFQGGSEDESKDGSGPYALHTLGEDETIARLANGVKRFKLPDEFNFIRIYQQVVAEPQTGYQNEALRTLAQIFENRRQYPRAAEYWKQAGDTHRLQQIIGNWGMFEPAMTQPAGKGATVEFRFRNGKKVEFEAYELLMSKLLDDVRAYIKTKPNRLDWNQVNIENVGYRLVQQKQDQYLGKKVAAWELDLVPRPKHFDRRITVTTPLQKAGAYLLVGKMADGNTSRIILWLSDTAIARKQLSGKVWYLVADSVSGQPLPGIALDFFGYQQRHIDGNRYEIKIQEFSTAANNDGQLILDAAKLPADYSWLITARNDQGRFAYIGFSGVWYGQYDEQQYHQRKVLLITDRPVYRPDQTVRFKFWVGEARYDADTTSVYANQSFTVQINNPKGEKAFERTFKADAYGGLDGEFVLPKDATLGQYYAFLVNWGGANFRVEEYKKPEFKVSVEAPKEPVALGDKITATVKAKYYFGAPVTNAQVKYKVLRSSSSAQWYPRGEWDWFYGPGYWWFAYDYDWYPGWREWGCWRPRPWWWHWSPEQPEVVMESQTKIGEDGTLKLEIDTSLAKSMHGNSDHRYEISAEVVDESRRTIVGSGSVLVARQPFRVYTWVDRGYYRVGDTIQADLSAQTPDGQPVPGQGELRLLKITYDEKRAPKEAEVQKWALPLGESGSARQQIKAAEPGQYRLSCRVTDARNHTMEGGYMLTVAGQGFDGSQFQFNDIELVPDRREYRPGEAIELMVNTNRTGAAVALFLRPSNGIYPEPRLLQLKGKSTVETVEITKKDMPNFFVEALTISNGKIHQEVREIVVPPEKRVLDVAVTPTPVTCLPGQKAKVKVQLTELTGEPFVGSVAMTIYDKSVEYISGGSNVPDIRSFFWKWRRSHYPHTESSLARGGQNLLAPNEMGMGFLGVFGGELLEEGEDDRMNGDEVRQQSKAPPASGMPRKRFAAREMVAKQAEMAEDADAAGAPGDAMDDKAGAPEPEQPQLVQPTVRSQFADTAFWAAALTTNAQGIAEIELTMPENLTTWMTRVWAMGQGTRVGQGTATLITTKNLLVRMQAPRFFVEKDEVVLSANVHNYLKTAKDATVRLALKGGCLEALGALEQKVRVEANGERRVDWRVRVTNEGQAVVQMMALTDEESDAMEMTFPAKVHGMMKQVAFSGVIRPDEPSATVAIDVPEARRIDQSRLEVRYSPTLAGAMVDALPYLVEYPYGCTEQTLSRFLPTAITQKVLMDMNLDLKAIQEKRTNLNAQELGDDQERAKQWKRWDRNPVFDRDTVVDMVNSGVKRLLSMQLSDGGWGWFSGWGEHSYPHTTAYVVHGFQIARENDVAVPQDAIQRGVNWLRNYEAEQIRLLKNAPTKTHPWKPTADNLDAFVFMVLADAGSKNDDMLEFLYRDRTNLSVYAKAMYGLALHKLDQNEKRDMLIRNIEQFLVKDDENQTAHLNLGNDGYWWYWYGSEYEAHAYYLKLLAKTDPKGATAPWLVKYILNNRKHGTYWNSTRDTAICIEALADYMRASGEDKPDLTMEILVDGKKQQEVTINSQNLFAFNNRFVLAGDTVESGSHKIEFRKKGKGPLYFNAYLRYFSLEDFIPKAGLEVKVNRACYRLKKVDKTVKVSGDQGQALDQKVEKYERIPLENLATLKSGELAEVELTIESKNDYEYLVFEDMKAAGFEPVDVQSGYTRDGLGAYMELRDDRVSFFMRWLARGKHSIAYRLRAEIPGKFSALPTRAYAMYAPELQGNSDEIQLVIED